MHFQTINQCITELRIKYNTKNLNFFIKKIGKIKKN